MNWRNMPRSHKIATVISCIAVLIWLVFKLLPDRFPVDLTYPAIAMFTVCEAVIYWKEKRKWAYLLIVAAVISLGCATLEFLWS